MEISGGLVNYSTQVAASRTQETAELAVLKKAIDLQAEGALALIEALPEIPTLNSVSVNIGQNIDIFV